MTQYYLGLSMRKWSSHWLINRMNQAKDGAKKKTAELIGENIPSFTRPTTEENIGIGFNCFISHEELKSQHYIVDDTLFLQVEIRSPSNWFRALALEAKRITELDSQVDFDKGSMFQRNFEIGKEWGKRENKQWSILHQNWNRWFWPQIKSTHFLCFFRLRLVRNRVNSALQPQK